MIIKKSPNVWVNILSNYFGQGYSIVLNIIITPFYINYLGVESYGVIGFFILAQSFLSFLDNGLAASLGRQVSFARGKFNGFLNFDSLTKSFELILLVLGIILITITFFGSDIVSKRWLKPDKLSIDSIRFSLNLMSYIIALKFFSTAYKSALNGFEDQIWLNQFIILISSIKYIGIIFIFMFVPNNLKSFFMYQLLISILETILLKRRFNFKLFNLKKYSKFFTIDWKPFVEILPFTLSIAYTTGLLIIITQLDKLLLSGNLSLETYGYFSLIAIISGGIVSLSIPVFTAFLPKMTINFSSKKIEQFKGIYIEMTQLVSWLTISSSILILLFAKQILYLITGTDNAYLWGNEILFWNVLGSCFFVLGSFQYYLQNSIGEVKIHLIASSITAVILIPVMYFVVIQYSALGASILWFSFNLLWFLVVTFFVHNKYLPGFHLKWLLKDLFPILFGTFFVGYLFDFIVFFDVNSSKLNNLIKIIFYSILYLILTFYLVPRLRFNKK